MLRSVKASFLARWLFAGFMMTVGFAQLDFAHAEYADIVINNYSDAEGMRPVVFPHWFHRIRFSCKVCHADLGFELKAGGNKIDMVSIIEGEFCGACHNGVIAWPPENCDVCHSAKPGTPTQVHGGTKQTLVAPVGKGISGKKTAKPKARVLD